MFEDDIDVEAEEMIKRTEEYELTRDINLLQYPRALKMYCATVLRKGEIAELCKVPLSLIEGWEREYGWVEYRARVVGRVTGSKLRLMESNGAEAYFVYGGKVRDQVKYMGNVLGKRMLESVQGEELKFRDMAGSWIKLKEMESELTGERREMSQTNIQINFSDVNESMKRITLGDVERVRVERELLE